MEMTAEHKAKLKVAREKAAAERKQKVAESVAKIEAESAKAEPAKNVETKKVTRRRTSFGPRLKLGVEGSIPGYHMQWINDYNGEVEDKLYNGWTYVGQDEIDLSNISFRGTDKDVGNRCSRATSIGPNIQIRCYLMKIEQEIYDEIMQEGEELARALEKPIYDGTYGLGEHDYKGNTRITTT